MSFTEIVEYAILILLITWPLGAFSPTGRIFSIVFDALFIMGMVGGVINSTILPSIGNLLLIILAVMLILRLIGIYADRTYRGPNLWKIIKTTIYAGVIILIFINVVTIGVDRGMTMTGAFGMIADILAYNDEDKFVLTLMGAGGLAFAIVDTILVAIISKKGSLRPVKEKQ